jgi:6-pyruvoyltetrahydropterin/6-carboxytetrahydropterin synthase
MQIKLGYKTTFDAAHRLPEHQGKCRNLHGHTYRIELLFSGPKGEGGMILDFGIVKQKVKAALDRWDHAVILYVHDPLLKILADNEPKLCIVVMEDEPTVEHMILLLREDVQRQLTGLSVEVVSIRVYETPTCWAEL